MPRPEPDAGIVFVDADDTLWENNVWFTRAIERWAAHLARLGVDPDVAVAELHAEEDRNIPRHGYGSAPFAHSLRGAFARLVAAPTTTIAAEFTGLVTELERAIRDHPIELLPGVVEGLEQLAAERRVVVLTKGQRDEQEAKVRRSGLERWLHGVRVVDEKDVVTYFAAAQAYGAAPAQCWMVGNSPRSDVNPARRAGLRTVHVPHPAPWHRDAEPFVAEGVATRVARSFADVPRLVLG